MLRARRTDTDARHPRFSWVSYVIGTSILAIVVFAVEVPLAESSKTKSVHAAFGVNTSTSDQTITESQIQNIALSAAAQNGDQSPVSVQYAFGTRSQANMVASGETVPGTAESVLVVEQGSFVAADAALPPGAAEPSGSVLTLVIDAASGQITDGGIQNTVPDLASLGVVTRATVNYGNVRRSSMRRLGWVLHAASSHAHSDAT